MRYSEEPCLILARAWRPARNRLNRPQHSDPHRHTGAGPPHRATAGSPRTLEPPPQARPARRIGPISLIAPPLSCPWAQKQKIGPDCNFFAISNCPKLSNRESRHKNAGNWPCCGLLPPSGDEKRAPNRKKVAKMPRFLFLRRAKTGATGRTAVTG